MVNWVCFWAGVAAIQLGRLLEIEFDIGGYWSCDEYGNFGVVGESFGRPAFVLVTAPKYLQQLGFIIPPTIVQ